MSDVAIRSALQSDRQRLAEIAVAAKGSWGYDPERVRTWGETVPSPALAEGDVFVATAGAEVVGWGALAPDDGICVLNDLWVDPAWMRKGVGSRLFAAAVELARARGAVTIEWEADPNAVGFYERLGASCVGESQPTVWGRSIPVMRLELGSGDITSDLPRPTG